MIRQTHSSTISTISARLSNTSLRAMMLGCCRDCSTSTSRSTALLSTPSRLHVFLRVLMNFAAHWVPVARSVTVRTCPKCPLCKSRGRVNQCCYCIQMICLHWYKSRVGKCQIVALGNVRLAHYKFERKKTNICTIYICTVMLNSEVLHVFECLPVIKEKNIYSCLYFFYFLFYFIIL